MNLLINLPVTFDKLTEWEKFVQPISQPHLAVNDQMETMKSTQPGVSYSSAIPSSNFILVLNIKNVFFFQIPLMPQCQYLFAITIWEPNMHKLTKDFNGLFYQGIKNSLTL